MENNTCELKRRFRDTVATFLKDFHIFFLDILFPISCLGCGEENEWLCDKCLMKISLLNEQCCPVCEKMTTPDGKTCFSCKKKTSLDGLLVCVSYKNSLVARSVHNYKYRFISQLSIALGKIITNKTFSSSLPLPDFIVPVPLHPRRLRWRGFNQSQLLAQELSENLTPGIKIPVLSDALTRVRYTPSQMKIKDYRQRRKNMENAFFLKNENLLKDSTIFLIDDIATTGSTLFECARTLKEKGVRHVFAVVVARQEIGKKSGQSHYC